MKRRKRSRGMDDGCPFRYQRLRARRCHACLGCEEGRIGDGKDGRAGYGRGLAWALIGLVPVWRLDTDDAEADPMFGRQDISWSWGRRRLLRLMVMAEDRPVETMRVWRCLWRRLSYGMRTSTSFRYLMLIINVLRDSQHGYAGRLSYLDVKSGSLPGARRGQRLLVRIDIAIVSLKAG